MPLNTNLSSSPYFDDFDRNNDYYRILFKPATAVQVREVNQLQTMLQDQIEQFGDHILKAGTILDGCQFTFNNSMPYVKILDTTKKGAAVNLERFDGLSANGQSSGKVARITHFESGFESDNINLKTLYLNYDDDELAGTADTPNRETFKEGEELRIFSRDERLWDITVANNSSGSQAFSNNDVVVITSAIEIASSTNGDDVFPYTFEAGDTITNQAGTIDMVLTHDEIQHPENNSLILRIKPNPADQYGSNINTSKWDLDVGDELIHTGSSGNNVFKIVSFIGDGASGKITTTAVGQIISAEITRGGTGYSILPYVSLYSVGVSSQTILNNLEMNAENWYQTVTVASTSLGVTEPIGYGYGVSVNSGQIYQKGLFLNVSSQFLMVDKYSKYPSEISVGFDSVESVVNVFTDSTLYDNAAGFLNQSAPGADRLKVSPVLVTKTSTEEKVARNYFPLVKFSEGKPYSQNKTTQYNKLGDMLAQRTYDESGNYVIDEFNATTRSPLDFAESDTTFSYVIDPGHAYIGGYRIKTETNFVKNVNKATDTSTKTNVGLDINYASYIVVNEMAGLHSFNDGSTISLKDAAANFVSDYDYDGSDGANTVSSSLGGNVIGTARIRNVVYVSGVQGTSEAKYRIYLFDIQMNKGKNFKNVRSIYTDNDSGSVSEDGIADVVTIVNNQNVIRSLKSATDIAYESNTEYLPTQYGNMADLIEPNKNNLIFKHGLPAKSLSNISYTYRTTANNYFDVTSNIITVPAVTGSTFPYSGSLSDSEENDIILIPKQDIFASSNQYSNVEFTVAQVGSTTEYVVTSDDTSGGDTTFFSTVFEVGDWITNGTLSAQITAINGQNKMTIRTQSGYLTSASSGEAIKRFFPKDIPIPLDQRSGMTASVNGAKTILTIDLDLNVSDVASAFTVTIDQKLANDFVSLTPKRGYYVKVDTAGEWDKGKCLGLSGIIRLVNVYAGTSISATNITEEFYVDSNQMPGYWGLGYLYQRVSASTDLSSIPYILVEVDYLDDSGKHGAKIINSYPLNDDVELASLRTSNDMHIMEIPDVKMDKTYFDLRECIDFRPMAAATVDITTDPTLANTASESLTFDYAQYRYPKPQTDFIYDIESYKRRVDEISVKSNGLFEVTVGARDLQRVTNPNKLSLYKSIVKPYPSLPQRVSTELKDIMSTNIQNNGLVSKRVARYTNNLVKIDPQIRVYTMNEISKLEARLDALEYNQNVSELENKTINRSIQSSVDSTIDRFKFGFFVDNFENYGKSATNLSYYQASIYEYVLQPDRTSLNIDFEISSVSSKYRAGNKVTFPFKKKTLVSQTVATYAPYVEPYVPTIEMFCEFESNRNKNNNGDSTGTPYEVLERVWEEFTFVATNEADGVDRYVELRFYNPAGNIAYEIIQSSQPPTQNSQEQGSVKWSPTNANIGSLDPSDGIELYQRLYPVKNAGDKILNYSINPWFESQSTTNFAVTTNGVASGTYQGRKGTGVIRYKYNHLDGRYITVRVHKKAEVFNFEICYPAATQADAIYDSGQNPFNNRPPACPRGTFKYQRCQGSTLVVYQCDGNYGTEVGYTVPNSPTCYVAPPPVVDPPEASCPPAGEFYKVTCSGTSQITYTYTGNQGSGPGGCSVTASDTVVCSSECGCQPPAADPTCDDSIPPKTNNSGDDGCVSGVDPECNIEQVNPEPDIPPTEEKEPEPEPEEEPVVQPPEPEPEPEPPVAPPKAPTGGGSCVHVDSYLPVLTEGQNRAYQMVPGSALWLGTEDLQVVEGTVINAATESEECVRITTESNITLVCSVSAPIYTSEGKYYNAPEVNGKQVAVMKDGKTWFDNVISIENMGILDVRPIDTGDNNFWAGEKDGEYIMHHNIGFFGRGRFSGGFNYDKK